MTATRGGSGGARQGVARLMGGSEQGSSKFWGSFKAVPELLGVNSGIYR